MMSYQSLCFAIPAPEMNYPTTALKLRFGCALGLMLAAVTALPAGDYGAGGELKVGYSQTDS